MKGKMLIALCALLSGGLTGGAAETHLRAQMTSFEEIPTNVTPGTGTFTASVSGDTITFTLNYSNLSTPVVQAHIHLGATKTSGGVALFLCGPAGSAVHTTCPNDSNNSGTVTDTLTASDVVLSAQGVQPGQLAKILQAIGKGHTYVNVHTMLLPGGEIRGQVAASGD